MHSFKGSNATKLHYDTLMSVIKDGDECSPRGKLIKELRPTSVEFTNPYNRVTFLGSRRINPFFMVAESLWILSGRADVEWLTKFNANMIQFSDDGKFFNASYGERLRSWGKNALHGITINPVDQLADVYTKLLHDKDTRQAVMVISNPHFDNAKYTIGELGKDIGCNLAITFKIRHDKLHMTVFNRSNDLIWGLFGANLCQFTTIQETLLSWLKHSGVDTFANLELGTYCQVTDSLHVYLDDYGAKCATDVLEYYKKNDPMEVGADFTCENEPKMSLNAVQFEHFLALYWSIVNPYIMDDEGLQDEGQLEDLLYMVADLRKKGGLDDYWHFVVKSMIAYRLVKLDKLEEAMKVIGQLENCQWKISMLYFLKHFIYKLGKSESRIEEFNNVVDLYNKSVEFAQSALVYKDFTPILKKYLEL